VVPPPAEPFDPAEPAAGQPPAVQAAFTRLRAQFVAGLAQRWQEIDAAADPAAQQAALHRLAGAAGSYGLVALGDAARDAEAASHAGEPQAQRAALQALRQQLLGAGATLP